MSKVEFHFDFGSPNAYLAHKVLPAFEARSGTEVTYFPILLGGVFKLTNNKPPFLQFEGTRNKMDYFRLEMRRFIAKHGLTDFIMNPDFPINTVKIDQSFTQQAPGSSRDMAILRTIVTLCNELDLEMVAEGIETAEQKAFLQALGCTIGQGYLFYRPQPADIIEPILAASVAANNGGQR